MARIVSMKALRMPLTFGILRLLADPHAVVDHAAEMLDEVAVDLGRDGGDGLTGKYLDVGVSLCRLSQETGAAQSERGGGKGGGFEEGAA